MEMMNLATHYREQIQIPAGDFALEGILQIPAGAQGLVVFVHGSGSSRHSGRNQSVARLLQNHNLATLLFDLLTQKEEAIDAQTRRLRFDIELLAARVLMATDWLL